MAKRSQSLMQPKLRAETMRIRLLLLDVDGVLTEGGLLYGCEGDRDRRIFNVKDGAGIYLAIKHGFEVGILTGKKSKAVEQRASDLGITRIVQGSRDKRKGLAEIMSDGKYRPPDIAYIGDDIMDIPVFARVGFSACPADANPMVIDKVDYVCSNKGGHGAVREVIDLILTARGDMDGILRKYEEE